MCGVVRVGLVDGWVDVARLGAGLGAGRVPEPGAEPGAEWGLESPVGVEWTCGVGADDGLGGALAGAGAGGWGPVELTWAEVGG